MPRSRTLVICFGRFNPPTTGHESLLQFALKTAQQHHADLRVFPSQSQDPKKNPLPFAEKVKFLRTLFPHIAFNDNTSIRTPIDALMAAAHEKYTDAILVVGSDRVDEFMRFQKYVMPASSPYFRKDAHIPLNSYQVIPVPVRRGGASGVAGMSASKQRAFAVAGDYEAFKQGVPGQNDRVARAMYTAVRKHMNLKETTSIHASLDTNILRLPLTERADHDGEYHVKCKKCGAEWYADSRFGQTCKKCRNKDRAQMTFTGSETVYEATDSKLRDQAKKVEKELHNKAYQEVSKRPYWRNRDFNQKFDNEVEDVYVTHLRAYLKQHPELKSIFKLHEATERDKAEKAGKVRRRIVDDVKSLEYPEDRVYAAVELLLYLSKDSDQTPKIRGMIQDMAKKLDRILEENIQLPTDRTIAEAIAMPLKGHVYHKKTDAELWYVIKDASAAAHAMQSHNPRAEAKYLDQVNDAHTILHYRNNGGKRITEATTPYNKTGGGVVGGAASMLHLMRVDAHKRASELQKYSNVALQSVVDELLDDQTAPLRKGHPSWVLLTPVVNEIQRRLKFKSHVSFSPKTLTKIQKYTQIKLTEAEVSTPKPPSEVDRLKTRQKQDEIALKQRQANELMAAKLRDVQHKAREQQAKANAPKPASR